MKTLTEIAIECGGEIEEYTGNDNQKHEQICFESEGELQAFVDAVNIQNSEQEAVPENFDDWLQMIKTEALLGAAREARLEDDIRTLRNQLAEHKGNAEAYEQIVGHKSYREVAEEIESLRNQLAKRDELVKCATELRKWVADGEFSDDVGIFPNCATEEYKEAVQKFDLALKPKESIDG